jgi:serine protease inhibitor
MDKSVEQLVVAFLEGDLDEAGARRLAEHIQTHADDREEFLALASQARAMEALFAPAGDLTTSVLNELRARADGDRLVCRVLERLPRRRPRRRSPVAVAAAAAVLLAVGATAWLARPGKAPRTTGGPPIVVPTVQAAALAPGWRAEGRGAEYEIAEPGLVRLERGELFVESVPVDPADTPRGPLKIETSAGVAVATGTKFYIGSHALAPQLEGTEMTRMTRVLVLAGVVTLTNALGTVTGGANDLLAAEADTAPVKLAVRANSDFAFDMYQQLAKENAGKNLFFSPYSISSALAMTAEGARGQTAAEMGKVLRFPEAARRIGDDAQLIPWRTSLIHIGMAELNDRLTAEKDKAALEEARAEVAELRKDLDVAKARTQRLRKEKKWKEYRAALNTEKKAGAALNKASAQVDQYELRIANALWGEKTYPFLDDYVKTIATHYKTGGVFPSDFKNSFPVERERINKWVEDQTNQRIKDIIPELRPDEARLVRLILTNAIYFKGEWSEPFKEADTRPRDFTLADGKTVQTPIMNAQNLEAGRYGAFNQDGSSFNTPQKIRRGQKTGLYPDESGFALLELPYKGDDLSMVIIAPNRPDGLTAIEKKLNAGSLTAWIAKLQKRKTHVLLPKFKMETDYKLGETLQAMGMVRAFTDPRQANGADFTGMCASADPRLRLYISKVLHKAFVEVNEKGTEAAAATAVMMMANSAPITVPFTPTFKADRPFLFLIRDIRTGSVLFMGRMTNPKS